LELERELDLELDLEDFDDLELDELEPRPLDVPPTPPDDEEVFRLVMVPVVEVDVLGFTTDPVTGLFWNLVLS